MPWDFALILVVLGILAPWRGAAKVREFLALTDPSSIERLSVYASTLLFQWLAAGIITWRWLARDRALQEMVGRMPDPAQTALFALGLTAAVVIHQVLSLRSLAHLPPHEQGILGQLTRKLMPQSAVESLAFVALALTVSVCEEYIYRGFFLRILIDATDSVVVGVVASSALFALAHVYQGRRGLIVTFLVGLLFAVTRLWTDSILPPISAHLAADLIVGLTAPRLLRNTQPEGSPDRPTPETNEEKS